MTHAACIICDKNGDVLMVHAKTWEIPGGPVPDGQFPQVAVQEIIKKELGITVRFIRELGKRHDGRRNWFLGEVISGEPALHSGRYDKFGFFSLVTLTRRYDELSPDTKEFLEAMAYGEIDLDV
ncbi:MAG TPA: NUDIX domain-containing protein [Magnetospirillaceae bacterium]|nr:NUDIX domain-containing protein [Magnetospirillaceae bacterium]